MTRIARYACAALLIFCGAGAASAQVPHPSECHESAFHQPYGPDVPLIHQDN